MNVLIVGEGTEELAWASWFLAHPQYQLEAVYPGFAQDEFAGTRVAGDLDEALATAGIDLAVVGGPLELRGEALQGRGGGTGDPLYPPTGSRFRSVLPGRSEPCRDRRGGGSRPAAATPSWRGTVAAGRGGRGTRRDRGIRHECPSSPADGDLAHGLSPHGRCGSHPDR